MAFRSPIRRRRDGTYTVDLGPVERNLLVAMCDQLGELLVNGDPSLVRLFPTPYGDDTERNEGYAALVVPELTERRLAALETVRSTAQATQLTADELAAWMRSVNDVRLVLGTVLDVDETGSPPPADSPDADRYATYEYLGMVLELIVRAMAK
jgi:hypothetical protein